MRAMHYNKHRKAGCRIWSILLIAVLIFLLACTGCANTDQSAEMSEVVESEDGIAEDSAESDESAQQATGAYLTGVSELDLSALPAYSGEDTPYVEVNGNDPYFSEEDRQCTDIFESFSELDDLGRCGVACANICEKLLPDEERESIGEIKPSGWQSVEYDDLIDGGSLYNRCHLIAHELTGENDNERNLITGTRYMNVEGMKPFEDKVANYVESTGNHVLYRSTPVFEDDNLVASGVELEAYSVEDEGEGICFNVYCYNVQPGVTIDYATGDSKLADDAAEVLEERVEAGDQSAASTAADTAAELAAAGAADAAATTGATAGTGTSSNMQVTWDESAANTADVNNCDYVVNTNTGKFHYPSCDSVTDMKKKNARYYIGDRQGLIDEGFSPCQRCNP